MCLNQLLSCPVSLFSSLESIQGFTLYLKLFKKLAITLQQLAEYFIPRLNFSSFLLKTDFDWGHLKLLSTLIA